MSMDGVQSGAHEPAAGGSGFAPPPPPQAAAPAPEARRAKHLLPYGIGLFVVGLLVCVLGIIKVIPGGIGTGAAFAFWGILLFAFSFIPLPQTKGDEEPAMSGLQKITGIFFEPARVFRNLRAHPHWLAAFLVIAIVNAVYAAAFVQRLTPERIVDYTMSKMEDSPIKPPPDKMAETKEGMLQAAKQPIQRVQTAAKSFVGIFVFGCFVASLCLLGVLAFGGRMNFWQALAAIMYAYMPVAVISKVISTVILFIKSPDDIHPLMGQETLLQDNLGILFKPAEHPALFVLGTAIGVLSFYGLWLKATGLANAGQKVSSSAAWGVSITIWVLGLGLGVIFASLFSGFMS
jgi:Yip1 domain